MALDVLVWFCVCSSSADYLDNGNNKMAIQQADKLLKKHKDLHCAKVLKAIGLQRTGKQDEAYALAQEVAALEPTDDNSLQALTILYREMHRREFVPLPKISLCSSRRFVPHSLVGNVQNPGFVYVRDC